MSQRLKVIIKHSVIWLLYFFGLSLLFGLPKDKIEWEMVVIFFELVILIPVVYLNTYKWVSAYLFPRNYGAYGIRVGLFFLFMAFYNSAVWYFVAPVITGDDHQLTSFWLLMEPYYLFPCLIDVFSVFAVSTGYALLKLRHKEEKDSFNKQNQALQAEMQHLKSQINPHFFFNTLNNIYSLSLEQNKVLPDAILKFSGLMNYLFHESKSEKISLKKEIEFLNDYFELEKLRLKYPDKVSFKVEGNLNGQEIFPLLLLPGVENGFKHLDRKNPDYHLNVKLIVTEGLVNLTVENSCDSNKGMDNYGFGLTNLNNRLNLLYPKNDYKLIYGEHKSIFLHTLELPV